MQIGGAVRFGALTPALSHREREKTSSKISPGAIGSLSLWERARVRGIS